MLAAKRFGEARWGVTANPRRCNSDYSGQSGRGFRSHSHNRRPANKTENGAMRKSVHGSQTQLAWHLQHALRECGRTGRGSLVAA